LLKCRATFYLALTGFTKIEGPTDWKLRKDFGGVAVLRMKA
jgi:hypothetical protein